jgi:hypothetical protein
MNMTFFRVDGFESEVSKNSTAGADSLTKKTASGEELGSTRRLLWRRIGDVLF